MRRNDYQDWHRLSLQACSVPDRWPSPSSAAVAEIEGEAVWRAFEQDFAAGTLSWVEVGVLAVLKT
jgi:hypothetical protein